MFRHSVTMNNLLEFFFVQRRQVDIAQPVAEDPRILLKKLLPNPFVFALLLDFDFFEVGRVFEQFLEDL